MKFLLLIRIIDIENLNIFLEIEINNLINNLVNILKLDKKLLVNNINN